KPQAPMNPERALDLARRTLDIEAQALQGVRGRLGHTFVRAVERVLKCRGRVVVMGMGKSGHVGRKIAATLASTGTPAMFVHPAEASHGDLGMVTPQDVVLAISNSGESEELNIILPVLKRLTVPLLAITGRDDSTLARTKVWPKRPRTPCRAWASMSRVRRARSRARSGFIGAWGLHGRVSRPGSSRRPRLRPYLGFVSIKEF
ncbi:MAG: hypothetical protein RL087_1958, partial [Pseudomonadota bacterium]